MHHDVIVLGAGLAGLSAARDLVAASFPLMRQRGVTLVGFSVANLDDDGAMQLTLPFDGRSDGLLDAVLDDVAERFGSRAVTRAVLLHRDPIDPYAYPQRGTGPALACGVIRAQ